MVGLNDVGIIIPIYCKTEKSLGWLDECLRSAISQGCFVSIYDDGSPLDINPIISKYIKNNDRIVYSRSAVNNGVSYARNWAVVQCQTKLIFPLDCDDIIVDGAISALLKVWKGTPVYPDIEKFGNVNVKHYALLDFHCDHLYNHVGFTSVNVLHSKAMWKEIGGWDNDINFYEDGEYNARLLGTYCGVHYPVPLVRYRIHNDQRTVEYRKQAHEIAKKLQSRVRSYTMACPGCAKKRATQSNSSITGNTGVSRMANITGQRSQEMVDINSITLPVEFEGKLLVQYVGGKGRGRHYYKGIGSGTTYKVLYGDVIYADAKDVKESTDQVSPSLLVRIYPEKAKATPKPSGEPVLVKKAEVTEKAKSPRVSPEKEPVVEEEVIEIDPANMTVAQIMEMSLTKDEAAIVLEWEKEGKSRKSVIEHLEKLIADE